jgi:hypothetical protein
MKIVHLEGNNDGNCLFRSCSYHIGIDYHKLRQQVANVIRDYPNLPITDSSLTKWLEMAGHNPYTYHQYIAQNGVYGTGIELTMISIIYRRCIRIMKRKFCPQQNKYYFKQIAEYFPDFGHPFYLMFSGSASSGHYDPLE